MRAVRQGVACPGLLARLAPPGVGKRTPSSSRRRNEHMDQYLHRALRRRSIIRGAAVGAGAVGLGLSGAGRFGSPAWAQEATPAASGFDAAACYQPFPGAVTVQYEKLADPPYNIA